MEKPKSSVPAPKPSEKQPSTQSQNLSADAERVFVQLQCLHVEEQLRAFRRSYVMLANEFTNLSLDKSLSQIAWREIALAIGKRYRKDAREFTKLARRMEGARCVLRP